MGAVWFTKGGFHNLWARLLLKDRPTLAPAKAGRVSHREALIGKADNKEC